MSLLHCANLYDGLLEMFHISSRSLVGQTEMVSDIMALKSHSRQSSKIVMTYGGPGTASKFIRLQKSMIVAFSSA